MIEPNLLHDLLAKTATRHPDRVAIRDPGRGVDVTYRDLEFEVSVLGEFIRDAGIAPGDRVGICLPKSASAVAVIFGILRIGAIYVPLDAGAPSIRNKEVLSDSSAVAVFVEPEAMDFSPGEVLGERPIVLCGNEVVLRSNARLEAQREILDNRPCSYILYTSGSTGTPKGVMHSDETASAFIEWSSGELKPTENDRFSSHAPFHFDLSIFDLFVCIKHASTLVLIDEKVAKHPASLAGLIAAERITIWYSTPSVLRLLTQEIVRDGGSFSDLRLIIFAGEVFPKVALSDLAKAVPAAILYNFFGPTETNVCTFHRVTPADLSTNGPLPIGRPCSRDDCMIYSEKSQGPMDTGPGELCVAGGSVMLGYWALSRDAGFIADDDGTRWYRTGDIVSRKTDGNLVFHGRADRMVKRRGYRIELGELESVLGTHADVRGAAVIASVVGEDKIITAFVVWGGNSPPSTIAMKSYGAKLLPLHAIPDRFVFLPGLPTTSTDKVDYRALEAMA